MSEKKDGQTDTTKGAQSNQVSNQPKQEKSADITGIYKDLQDHFFKTADHMAKKAMRERIEAAEKAAQSE